MLEYSLLGGGNFRPSEEEEEEEEEEAEAEVEVEVEVELELEVKVIGIRVKEVWSKLGQYWMEVVE